MTTEQKIEVLEKDILQRTGRYFTSVRTNGRLGQEDASASGMVYSAAMLSPKDKHVLGSIDADWSNIDSKAIREAASRVRARTREKCLFFIVSDGAPCEPAENVRKAEKELSRDGFSIVIIGIDFEYDPSAMYDHHVSMTDMSRLAPELGKMIKKAIMDNSKRQWK